MSGALVEPMASRQLREIMRIDAQAYPRPWSRQLWLAELGRDQRLYLVARDGGAIVGYVGAMFVQGDVHIMTLVTRPGNERQGVATQLMLAVMRQAVKAGCGAATLEVRLSNNGAQALYSRFGMEPAGIRPGYYEPELEDALVMWVKGIDTPAYREHLDLIGLALESVA